MRVKEELGGANANIISPEMFNWKDASEEEREKLLTTLRNSRYRYGAKPSLFKLLVKKRKIDYKYNEDKILNELKQYIDSTYDKHYSHNKL